LLETTWRQWKQNSVFFFLYESRMTELISVPAWYLTLAPATVSVTFTLGCLLAISHFLAACSSRGWDFHPRCPSKKYFSSDSAHEGVCGQTGDLSREIKINKFSSSRAQIQFARNHSDLQTARGHQKYTDSSVRGESERSKRLQRAVVAPSMHAKLHALCEISLSTPLCRCCCCCCEAQKKDAHAGELLLAFRMRAF